MALPVNTFTTYDAVGNREDLSDAIYDISPTETPFVSSIARTDASATLHEWQTDALDAATITSYLEGDDATADAGVATSRPSNRCAIYRKVISVSGTQRSVRSAGRADEYEYQLAKRGRELKRNVEKALLGKQNTDSPTSTATARQLGGVATWLSSNNVHLAVTTTTPGGGTGFVEGGAITVTTVTQLSGPLDTVIQQCWTAGGDPATIMVDGPNKQRLADLPGIATLYRDVSPNAQAQVINGADAYVSSFGNHVIVPNRFMPSTQIYCLDLEFWAVAELRPMTTEPLAKTGDSDRAMLICELTLEARNEGASGKIDDIAY